MDMVKNKTLADHKLQIDLSLFDLVSLLELAVQRLGYISLIHTQTQYPLVI